MQRWDRVAQAETRPGRWPIRIAGHVAHASGCFGDRSKSRLVAQRSVLSVTGNANDDQPRVGCDEVRRVEIPFLQPTGPKVLEQHVALHRKPADEVLIAGVVEVGTYRQLAARLDEVPERFPAVASLAPFAERVARARLLDLDDLCPEVGEVAPGKGSGDQCRELQHSQPGQRASWILRLLFRIAGHDSTLLDNSSTGQESDQALRRP